MDEDVSEGTTAPLTGGVRSEPANDQAARDMEFAMFYKDDLPRLVAFLVVQGARPVVAAELAQDAMTEAYRQWDRIDAPRAWVRTVASRTWWRRAERDRAEVPHDELPEPGALLSEQESAEVENRHVFLAMVRELPLNQRQVMAWTYDGYRPTEIAALLGKDPATVRSALREARATLKKTLRPRWSRDDHA
ncbi:sigma-70 family RNA polymerase sigma factor [Actinomadura graeca]|uniref:Sigma-70 family RNA polymerase sigma factor n=1 Tax=Actinomadura graeca TaxID=2750812 RepID=A0ABX8QUY4_9ACTN|nr:sigma-70 family RNA polymerase sigma factor [Actinomadura graeca]QXJ22181.1 sigma-70 family RNA polymerase sigma factor [Actinomadura graeca]